LYPYKIAKRTQAGIKVQSLSSWKVLVGNKEKLNTTVVLENACASNISNEDFKRLMALFGKPVDERSNVYNFVDLLNIKSSMTDTSQIAQLVKELGFPAQLVDRKQRVEVNMRRLASFISMSSPVCFGAPEGQTRMEAASRPCFGFPLYSWAPLRDKLGPLTTDFDQTVFFKNSQSLPPGSTAFTKVQGSVLFSSADNNLDIQVAELLQKISGIVQAQSTLEVNTTFQHFYRDVIEQVTSKFDDTTQPLTPQEWANYDVKSEPLKKRTQRPLRVEEQKLANLNNQINRILIHRVFTTPPFNSKLPQNPADKDKVLTEATFLQLSLAAKNWFTQKPFYTCFNPKTNINFGSSTSNSYYLPKKLNNDLSTNPSLSPLFNQCAWSSPNMVFEMMFSVLSYQPLLATFQKYIQHFKATSRFYDPLWLSAYVFYPVSCLSHFYKEYYFTHILVHDITKNMQGKLAPLKAKLLSTFRNIFLEEYFNTIRKYANANLHSKLPTFQHFRHAQRCEYENWTGSTSEKHVWVASEFFEMVLLTLPEKLNERIFLDDEDKFSPFEDCDFHYTTGRFLQRVPDEKDRTVININDCLPLDAMPTIADLLPANSIPHNVVNNHTNASAYTTITLEDLVHPHTKKIGCKAKEEEEEEKRGGSSRRGQRRRRERRTKRFFRRRNF
jgi:hypothetical protein